jgi:hypothetical protein
LRESPHRGSRSIISGNRVRPPVIIFGEAGILWFGLVVFSAENQAFSSEN